MFRSLVAISLLLLPFALAGAHAQQSQWQNLAQIQTGQRVTVTERDAKRFKGSFARFTEGDLTLRTGGTERTIRRGNVTRVSVKGGHRGRNALLGALVGGGAGMAVGAAVGNGQFGARAVTAIGGVGFAVVGAGIGALFPGSRIIYQADASQ